MDKTLLILGARSMQLPAIRTAKEMGLKVVVIDPLPDAVGMQYADNAYVFDLADEECIEIARRHKVNGVMTLAADYPLPMVARICHELKLPGPSCDAVHASTNKHAMRELFAAAGIPAPRSRHAMTLDEALEAHQKIDGPTIFKPVLCQGGRGITYISARATRDEIKAAFERAVRATRADGILVEEFIDGPEFSVEAITFAGMTHVVAVTDKLTSGEPYFVELGHTQPSQWPSQDIDQLIQTAITGVKALGIDWAASHTEIRLGTDGPCIMEIAARMGGGYITTHLVPLSTGIDMVKAAICLALQEEPDLNVRHDRGAAVRFLTADPGRVVEVSSVDTIRHTTGVCDAGLWVSQGDEVIPLLDSDGRVGYVICEAVDPDMAVLLAEQAKDRIVISTSNKGHKNSRASESCA